MKFKYTGQAPIKDVDLVLAGIFKPDEPIVNGTIFEIPNDNKRLIKLVKMMGIYEEYHEPKRKVKKPKKEDKEEKIEEEE